MPAYNFSMQMIVQSPTTLNLSKVRTDVQKALTGIGFTIDAKNIKGFAADLDKLKKKADKALSTADNFAEAIALKGVNFASYAIATSVVVKLGQSIAQAVTESIRFEKELAVLAQTVNITVDSAKQYSNEILNISRSYGLAQNKAAELVRVLAQAGLSLKQSLKAADALAKTTLIGTFDSLNSTTEAFIALMSSFSLSVDDATKALESINVVSKAFAVESQDIVEAITRAGGAFKAAGGNVEELIALFTSVRSYGRESAETISTGFRAIFGRLQRPVTIKFFDDLGIKLQDAEGQFVGGYEAIKRISQGIKDLELKSTDVKYANIVEQIGGIYQLSRVVALLSNFENAEKAYKLAQNASIESDIDAAKAKETLAFKIDQLRANFSALITEVSQTETFKQLTGVFLTLANEVISFANAVKSLLPLLSILAGVKIGTSIVKIFAGGFRGALKRGSGSGIGGYAEGGFVPGTGNGDTVPAMLTPGEFVITKKSAKAFGYGNLKRINKYARGGIVSGVQHFADGGQVNNAAAGFSNTGSFLNLEQAFGSLVNQISPVVTSFGLLSLQTRLATGATAGFAKIIQGGIARSKEEADKRAELIKQIEESKKSLTETRRNVRTSVFEKQGEIGFAKQEARSIEGNISVEELIKNSKNKAYNPVNFKKFLQDETLNIISGGIESVKKSQNRVDSQNIPRSAAGQPLLKRDVGGVKEQKDLDEIISNLKNKYRNNSNVLEAINNIQKSMPGEIKQQLKAVNHLSSLLNKTSLEEKYIIGENKKLLRAKKENIKALEEELKSIGKSGAAQLKGSRSDIKNLQSQLPKSTSSRIGKALKIGATSFGLDAASLGVSLFTSNLDKASQSALSLSESLIESGNATQASAEARISAEKEAQSSSIQFFATTGASIGAFIGAFFGPVGVAVGGGVGTLVGALTGLANSVFKITDYLGLTNNQLEIDARELEAAKRAEVVQAEKQVSIAKQNFKNTDKAKPEEALKKLEESVTNYIGVFKNNNSKISLGEGIGLDSAKLALEEFMNIFSSLADSSDFVGMSFEEIAAKNKNLVNGLEKLYKSTNQTEALDLFIKQFNNNQNLLKAQREATRLLIAEELRYLNIQKQINNSTIEWSKSINLQNKALRSIDFSKTGTSLMEKVDFSNFELENRTSSNFKNALDTISKIFPGLSKTATEFEKELGTFDLAKTELARLDAINLGTNQISIAKERENLAKDISEILKGANLDQEIAESITLQIEQGQNPIELLQKIIENKAKNLQKPLDLIISNFEGFSNILKEKVDFEAKQLDQSISIQKIQQSNSKMVADIISNIFGEDPIAEYQTALQNRIRNISKSLEPTRLANLNVTGGNQDIANIGASLEINKARQNEIDAFIQTGKVVDDAGNSIFTLKEEMASLQLEANGFQTALKELGDTSSEVSSIQKALEKSLSNRAKLKETAGDLAFGTRESRKTFLKTLQQAKILSFTGNVGSIKESDRQSLKSFLTEFKDLPVFNGFTGGQIMNTATENFLLSTGSSFEQVRSIMSKIEPIEKQMLDQLEAAAKNESEQLKVLQSIEQKFNNPTNIVNQVARMANGGSVFKPKGSDTVPAMLTPGEFIMSKSAVGKIGKSNLERMNSTGTIYASRGGYMSEGIQNLPSNMVTGYGSILGNLFYSPSEEEINKKVEGIRLMRGAARVKEMAERKREDQKNSRAKLDSIFGATQEFGQQFAQNLTKKYKEKKIREKYDWQLAMLSGGISRVSPVAAAPVAAAPVAAAPVATNIPLAPKQDKYSRIMERLKTERNPNVRKQLMQGARFLERKEGLIKQSNYMYEVAQSRKKARGEKEKFKNINNQKRATESSQRRATNPYYKGTKAYSERIAAKKDLANKNYALNKAKEAKEYNMPQNATDINKLTVGSYDEDIKKYGFGSTSFDPIKLKETIRQRAAYKQSIRDNAKIPQKSPKSIFGKMIENKNRQDTIPAMLTPGEFVLKKKAVEGFGVPTLKKMNNQKVKGFANGGLVGQSSSNGFNNGGTNSVDYSSLTQSLIEFNSKFNDSVKQLIEMPKVFEISLQTVGVNVNLNGAEFLAKLPDVLKSIVLDNIQSEIGNITSQVKKTLASGN